MVEPVRSGMAGPSENGRPRAPRLRADSKVETFWATKFRFQAMGPPTTWMFWATDPRYQERERERYIYIYIYIYVLFASRYTPQAHQMELARSLVKSDVWGSRPHPPSARPANQPAMFGPPAPTRPPPDPPTSQPVCTPANQPALLPFPPNWAILGSSWGHIGVIVGSFWAHIGIILGSSWGHRGVFAPCV